MPRTEQLGAKLGPRVATLMGRAAADTYRHTMDTRARVGVLAATGFFRTISAEIRTTVASYTRELSTDEDAPEWLRRTLAFMADGRGEWQAILNVASFGSGLAGLGGLISNEISPLVQKRLSAQPNAVLSPASLATLVARRLAPLTHGQREANKSAISDSRFGQLVDAAQVEPDASMLWTMEDRGVITRERMRTGLRRLGYREEWVDRVAALARNLLSPEIAASMVIRGVISQAQGARVARDNGLTDTDFERLVRVTGNPPGTMDLLAAFRRGLIDRARLHRGIRQGDLRNEWIDVIERLRFAPMTAEQAIAAAVQGHLSEASARRIAQLDGLLPEHFKPLLETAGNPPGVHEMLEMWNRGAMTRAQVIQGIRESRYKTKYIPQFLAMRHRVLPQDTIRLLLRRGLLTRREATDRLLDGGFSAADAAKLVAATSAEKTDRQRDLTVAQTEALYEEGAIDRDRATRNLQALGYDPQESELVLRLSDLQRSRRGRERVLTRIQTRFVNHRITDAEAQVAMDRAGVPAAQRDALLAAWDIERDANVRVLTPAQLAAAHKRGLLSPDELFGELRALGYDERDASILVTLATPAPKAPRG